MHPLSRIRRAVSMNMAIEDSKRYNMPTEEEKLKRVSQRRGNDTTKNF